MRIELKEKPSKPRIVQGFPGFGFVGTIAMEFLIEHLKAELIGEFFYDVVFLFIDDGEGNVEVSFGLNGL